jgi:hypothetical protein
VAKVQAASERREGAKNLAAAGEQFRQGASRRLESRGITGRGSDYRHGDNRIGLFSASQDRGEGRGLLWLTGELAFAAQRLSQESGDPPLWAEAIAAYRATSWRERFAGTIETFVSLSV